MDYTDMELKEERKRNRFHNIISVIVGVDISLIITLLILSVTIGCLGDTQSSQPSEEGILTITPLEASISEDKQATFKVTINTTFDISPMFNVTPIRGGDERVLDIDDSELKNLDKLYKGNSITRNLRISGRVYYGDTGDYGVMVKLTDKESIYNESETLHITVNRVY